MKVGALIFLLSPFIPLHHGIRFPLQNWVTPAWENSIPEIPQGPEVVLSLETLERNDLVFHGTPVLVCNMLGMLGAREPGNLTGTLPLPRLSQFQAGTATTPDSPV